MLVYYGMQNFVTMNDDYVWVIKWNWVKKHIPLKAGQVTV